MVESLPQIESLAGRMRWARERSGLSQDAAATKLHVSQGAIEKTENGKVQKPKFLFEASQLYNVPYEWLKSGIFNDELMHKNAANSSQKINGLSDKVPVYGYAAGSSDRVALNEGAIVGMRERGNSLSYAKNGFYVVVIGDSMEPRLRPGELVAVNPALPPIRGDECVIEYQGGEAVVKTFISMDDTKITVSQYNPPKKFDIKRESVVRILQVVAIEKGR